MALRLRRALALSVFPQACLRASEFISKMQSSDRYPKVQSMDSEGNKLEGERSRTPRWLQILSAVSHDIEFPVASTPDSRSVVRSEIKPRFRSFTNHAVFFTSVEKDPGSVFKLFRRYLLLGGTPPSPCRRLDCLHHLARRRRPRYCWRLFLPVGKVPDTWVPQVMSPPTPM